MTREADVEALVKTAVDEFGRIDAMLNVAGIAEGMLIADITDDHYERTMNVEASIVSSVPRGVVHGFSAAPEVSRFSPYYAEALKGVAIGVTVQPNRRPVRVVVRLRQVCAKFFRNSFLYY